MPLFIVKFMKEVGSEEEADFVVQKLINQFKRISDYNDVSCIFVTRRPMSSQMKRFHRLTVE